MKALDEANLLSEEIKQLERFIQALDVPDLRKENSNVTAIIKKSVETKTTYSIFGRRFFGCGAHEHTINVPTSVIPMIVFESKTLLRRKQEDFQSLFSDNQQVNK